MSLTVHHYTTTTSIDPESLLCTARRLAFDGKWLTPAFRRTLQLNFDAQWEYAIPPPVFDVGNRTNRPLRDWGDLEEDGDEGKGLEELEEWVPWSREDLHSPVQKYGDIEMDEADGESHSPSTRLILDAGSNGKSKHSPISQSNSTKARLEDEVYLGFTRGADNEGFDEADTGFHIDEDEMEEDMSFGFFLSGRSGVSYDWGDDNQVDEDEINTAFIEDEGPDEEEDEAGVESGLLSLSQGSKTKDLHLSRRVSDALRDMEDNAVFERGWSNDADTGFHVEDEEDDYMDSQFFLPSIDRSRSDDEANAAPLGGDRNPQSVNTSLPDVPIEPPDESPDFAMLDEDENEDANTGFIDFKAALDTDEEDEEEDIDSRFILSDGDIQYHHGSISEILDADDFTVQDVKEEEEGETEKHIEGEYEEDKISEWVDEDDSQVHGSENASGDYEFKGHPSRLIPIPQTITSRLLTSSVHTPQRFLAKYRSLSTRVESLGSGLGWIIPVTTPGGVVLIDGHESPGCWTPRSLAAFWGFLGTLHKETGVGVAYDFFGGRGYFFKLYHCAGLSVLLRGRLDEWVWRDGGGEGEGEGGVRMFKGLRLLLRDSVNKEVGFW
ncbi:uncharacterized protein EV420DRAFT_1128208 [Desarmillaria tabescens]|uniref:Uncharacterized protein n=1 Tax=Armillaria tabescens TaxID=1929756 RepID=A0AA39JF67_ARMTA|nr:uncharacterized protein EV420DRAFT_1128208 [Desarmillaria tabescens]KAK0440967.1 hypothetical protein EV420DRAFT_1128208 [Desarmillaria tabescens]